MRFDSEFLSSATGGTWQGSEASVDDVSIDTRTLPKGALYVAIKGERLDGHAFIAQAREAGAAAVLVDHAGDYGVPALLVKDTLVAMQALAHAHRKRLNAKFVGVCGSNGKTTTKEMIASVLQVAGTTHRTTGNLNNHIGLPLSLLRMNDSHRFGVLETGMNHPGELAELGRMLVPEIGVLTTIQAEHLEGLGTIENVAKAEGELFPFVTEVAIVPSDEPLVRSHALPGTMEASVVTFGVDGDMRLVEHGITDDGGTSIVYHTPLGELRARLPHLGRHNALNAGAAIAVGLQCGLSLAQIVRGLEQTPLVDRRLRMHRPGRWLVIDDCYNANPGSMGAALEVLRVMGKGKRKVALLGDMLELGEAAPHEHELLGKLAREIGIEVVCAFGPHASLVSAQFATNDMEAFIRHVSSTIAAGDVILVKGSRGMKMERVLPALGVASVEAH